MKDGKKDSCTKCPGIFVRCVDCVRVGMTLKRKYRVGKEPGRITAKARTGSSKRRNSRESRFRQRPNNPRWKG